MAVEEGYLGYLIKARAAGGGWQSAVIKGRAMLARFYGSDSDDVRAKARAFVDHRIAERSRRRRKGLSFLGEEYSVASVD